MDKTMGVQMASRKPSARAKRQAAFRSELFGADDAFGREERRMDELDRQRERARVERSCTSKRRYATYADAQDALAACAEHGRRGLSIYKCPHCNGWHLTSHPWTDR